MKYLKCFARVLCLIPKKLFFITIVLLLFYSCVSIGKVLMPLLFEKFIDGIEKNNIIELFYGFTWVGGTFVLEILNHLLLFVNDLTQYRIVNAVSLKVFNRFINLKDLTSSKMSSQELTSYTHDYVESSVSIFNINKSSAAFELAKLLCLLVLMFYLDVIFGVITIITICITVLIYRFGNKTYMKNAKFIREKAIEFYDVVEDQIEGRDEIDNLKIKGQEKMRVKTSADIMIDRYNIQNVKNFIVLFLFQDYVRIFYELIIVAISLYFVFIGRISLGTMVVAVMYSVQVSNPIIFFNAIFASLRDSFNDMEMLLDVLPESSEDVVTVAKLNEIKISDDVLCGNYDGSFTFKRGNIYLVDGSSGCGKSKLLEKIVFGKECVFLSEDGKNLEHATDIAYLPQSPTVFPISLRENILLGDEDARCSEVISLLRLDHLNESPVIDESSLSGGERSKICFARILLSKKEWLILDEPLTGIGADEVKNILLQVKKFFANKTIIFTSHDTNVRNGIFVCGVNSEIVKLESSCMSKP
ncbi:MAG: ABC transporter ATP-binding protein [Spirochaetaceae bacterium]|nr:ABC transporter ATP-binding protein [Spirochaetaceae bacterium]